MKRVLCRRPRLSVSPQNDRGRKWISGKQKKFVHLSPRNCTKRFLRRIGTSHGAHLMPHAMKRQRRTQSQPGVKPQVKSRNKGRRAESPFHRRLRFTRRPISTNYTLMPRETWRIMVEKLGRVSEPSESTGSCELNEKRRKRLWVTKEIGEQTVLSVENCLFPVSF